MDLPNLEEKLSYELYSHQLQLITKVKFQNISYQVGDNIRVRSDINSQNDLYAKILSIIQAKNVTSFPLLYVAWFQQTQKELIKSITDEELSSKELVLTSNKDWQYIEAVRGKVSVVSEEDFMVKDPSEQENKDVFFCRSYLTEKRQLVIDSQRQCFCQKYRNEKNPLQMCQVCKVMYHPGCGKGQDGRCVKCSY